ncbi:MAG TPA: hypothetical protein VIF62_21560 [Labilithrix sp.]
MTTHQVYIEPCAVVVGLPSEHVTLCHEVFGAGGIRVHAVADVSAATERITKVLPQLVVASANLGGSDRERVEDGAVAVGAVYLLLAELADYLAIERQLESAVAIARERFGKSGSR